MAKVSFIGLGVMGYPMAGHLKTKGGHDVTVYNRTKAKADAWAEEFGGKSAPTPADAARDADVVFCCVGNDDDLRSVTTGEGGAFETMKANSIFVDNTTASADVARELHSAARDGGFHFLDAPVSGGQAGAENGVLTVMVGGDEDAYIKAEELIMCYAKASRLMGPPGAGQLTKMVNQICIAGLVQALSEGVHFAKKAGLDPDVVFDVIDKGAAGSWQMINRNKTMSRGEFEFGFAVDWMRKDLSICLDMANQIDASLPVTALVDQFYHSVQKMDGGRWDTSSLLALLEKND